MRVIIAGSREFIVPPDGLIFRNAKSRKEAIEGHEDLFIEKTIQASCFDITEVVCGMARGADLAGLRWAKRNNISVVEMPADWDKYGKSAGYRRNVEMAEYVNENGDGGLIVIIRDGSKGSTHMLNIAKEKGLKTYVIEIEG